MEMLEESMLGNARLMELNQPSLTKRGLRDGFIIGYKTAYGKRTCSERTLYLAGRYLVHHRWKAEVKPAEFKKKANEAQLVGKVLSSGTACSWRWQILC